MVFRGRLLMVCLLDREIAAPTRWSLPSCSRPSRTLRAAGAVARRRAILDRRCARRHVARAGRDGRMAAIEQKDGAPARDAKNVSEDGLENAPPTRAGNRAQIRPVVGLISLWSQKLDSWRSRQSPQTGLRGQIPC